ncbi:MAG: alkyl hydroperoxide reductase/thiol specific antioxidant/Mal allergen [Bacteroidetes bacterium]|nr:alkyl hydroperoxide reductase/thiol specific antioxidant/Mal allergen [Bacteroidota bacterium]
MKRYQLCFFLLILVITSCLSFAQTKTIQLELNGRKYKGMHLRANLYYGLKSRSLDVRGHSTDGANWKFTIPDSIARYAQWYDIMGDYDPEQKKVFWATLLAVQQNDTIDGKGGRLLALYDEKMPVLRMKYVKSQAFELPSYQVSDSVTMENGQLIFDQFLLDSIVKGSDFAIELENSQVSTPFLYNDNAALIHALDSLSQKYPDSHYLMVQASIYAASRANKIEGKKIYNNFSEANKKNYWGERMKKYLYSFPFQNMELPTTTNLDKEERVIIDPKKYNLIVFSASWCGPCKEEIPILKEIYTDLKEKLDIVYISIDEPKTVAAWQKLMQTESIPWRSLNAHKDIDEMQRRYHVVFGIPCCLLVAPDGKAEFIDVRKIEDQQQLYRLFGVSKN